MADIKITVDSSELKRATQHTEELRGATSRFEAKLKPLIDKERQFNKAVRQVNDAMRLGVATQKQAIAEVERLGKAYGRTKTQIDRTTASMTGIRKNTNRMNATIQNAGYQLGDFAVQVQSGQNVMVAFSQQGAQLAGLLPGVAGAITGVALVIGSGLARALMEGTGLFKSFKEEVEEAGEALEALRGKQEKLSSALKNDLGPEAVRFSEVALKRGIVSATKEANDALEKLTETLVEQSGKLELRKELAYRLFGIQGDSSADKKLLSGLEDATELMQRISSIDPTNAEDLRIAIDAITQIVGGEFGPQLKLSEKSLDNLVTFGYSLQEQLYAVLAASREQAEESGKVTDELEAQKIHLEAILKLEQARDRIAGSIEQKFAASTRKLELMRGGMGAGLAGSQVSMEQQIAQLVAAERTLVQASAGDTGMLSGDVEQHMLEFENSLRTRLGGYMQEQAAIKELSAVKTATATLEGQQQDAHVQQQIKIQEGIEKALDSAELQLRQKISLIGLSKEEAELTKFIYDLEKKMGATRSQLNEEQAAQFETILELRREELALMEQKRLEDEKQKVAMSKVQAVSSAMATETVGALKSIVNGTKTASEAFRDMALNIIQQIMDILIWQPLITSLTNAFSSALTPASSGGSATGAFGSFVGSIFGFQKGGAFSAGNVIPFANGGVVGSPTMFGMSGGRTGLMGEAGPEAIMPLKRGAGGKLGVEGGGNVTVHQTFNFAANGDESVKKIIAQAAPKIAQMTEAKIINSRQRGGQMRRAFG